MSREKRKNARMAANLFAEIASASSGDSLGRAVVVDVSIAGVAVESETDLDIGNVIDCHIEVPLRLKAVVVRRKVEGQVKQYGLRFLNQSIFDKFLLKKVLKGSRQSKKVSL